MKNYSHSFAVETDLPTTFSIVFDDKRTLDAVHGPGRWTATPWASGKRTIDFELEPAGIPAVVLKIIGNGKMAAHVKQTISGCPESELRVANKVRPKVLGAEFVRVRPTFTLTKESDLETRVAVSCDVCAMFPPPLNGIVEEFMRAAAETSFTWLEDALRATRT